MNKSALTILSGFFILLFASWSMAAADFPQFDIHIEADRNEFHFETEHFEAQGHVRITGGDMVLTADKVTGDATTGDLQAVGAVKYADSKRNLKAERLVYNNKTGDMAATGSVHFQDATRSLIGNHFVYNRVKDEGVASEASANIDNILFRAREMTARPGEYRISESRFTACNALEPHYYLSARELVLTPGKKLIARKVSIVFYGKRLLTIPSYTVKLGENRKDRSALLPNIGISDRFGTFISYNFDLSREPGLVGDLNIRLSTRETFQGGTNFRRINGQPIFVGLGYREPYYGGRRSDTLLTRLPEVGYRFYGGDVGMAAESAGEIENLYRQVLAPSDTQDSASKVNFVGQISAGHYSEEPNRVSTTRLDTRAFAWLRPTLIGKHTGISPGVSLRHSIYGSGDSYTDLAFRLAAIHSFGNGTYIAGTYINHGIGGNTPFAFDTVEIAREVAAMAGFRVGTFTFRIGARYDADRATLFDSEVSVAKTIHCLEPRITWRNRFKELSLGISVVGF